MSNVTPPPNIVGEIVSLRDETSKSYLRSTAPDGSEKRALVKLTGRVHYPDPVDGRWRTIQPVWVYEGGGIWAIRANNAEAIVDTSNLSFQFRRRNGARLRGHIRAIGGVLADDLNFDTTGAHAPGNGRVLVIPDILPGLDLRLVYNDVLRPMFWVKSASAPRSFEWDFTARDLREFRIGLHENDGRDNLDLTDTTRTTERHRIAHILKDSEQDIAPNGDERLHVTETWTGEVAMWDGNQQRIWTTDVAYPVKVNQDITEPIPADADDGFEDISGASWTSTGIALLIVGKPATSGYNVGLRFTTIALDQGVTIDAGTQIELKVYSWDSSGAAGRFIVYGDDVDNAAAWSGSSRPSQITQTTASTTVNKGDLSAGDSQSIDVQSIVDEIVQRTGWSSGNAMRFGFIDNSPAYKSTDLVDSNAGWGDGTPHPMQLVINYTATTSYTLVADAGAVTIAGASASLLVHRELVAGAGAVTIAGQAAGLELARRLDAETGAVSIAGVDAGLLLSRRLEADAGAVTIAGAAAGLLRARRLVAGAGAVVIAGADATLIKGMILSAEAGAVTISGAAAGLLWNRHLDAEAGAVTIAGADATLTVSGNLTLIAEAGSVVIAGAPAGLLWDHVLEAEAGAVTIAGAAAGLARNRYLGADAGAVSISGAPAGLLWARQLEAEAGAVTIAGADAGLLYSGVPVFSSEPGEATSIEIDGPTFAVVSSTRTYIVIGESDTEITGS